MAVRRDEEVTEPWEDVLEAERVYYAARRRMHDAGTHDQLRLAFRHPLGRDTALRILRDGPIEDVMAFLPEIFDIATHLHGELEFARDLIDRLDSSWLYIALRPLIQARLDAPEAEYDDYQRIAEALQHWDQLAHLDALVARAKRSTDPDILEVAENYQRYDLTGRPIDSS